MLAGLQQTNISDTNGAVWLLSDIPLIGDIFKPERDSTERTELIFFIRPTIIKSAPYSKVLADENMHANRAYKEINNFFTTGKFHDINNDKSGTFETSAFMRTIGNAVFADCYCLKEFRADGNQYHWIVENGVLFREESDR